MPVQLSGSLQFTGSLNLSGSINLSGGTTLVSGSVGCFTTVCSPTYIGGTFSGTTVYGSTVICGASICSPGNMCIGGVFTGSSALYTGTITAQTLVVQTVSSSVEYASGSNIFGSQLTNIQQMTGSVRITGSLSTVGVACFSSTVCSNRVSTTDGSNISTLENNFLRSTAGNFYFDACTVGGNFNFRTSNASALDSTALFICGGNSRVGINTTTPAQRLDIGSGHIKLSDSYGLFYGTQTQVYASEASKYVRFDIAGTSGVMFLSGSGNVGIGTTSPTALLHNSRACNSETNVYIENTCTGTGAGMSLYLVENASTFSPAYGQLTHFNSGYSTNGLLVANRTWLSNSGGELLLGTRSAHDIILHTGGFAAACERMRITSGGNVGIGGTPSRRLDVYVCDSATYATTCAGNVLGIINTYPANNTFAGITFATEPTAGNAGLAAINSTVTSAGNADLMFSTRASSVLGERMRITSGGNVGIGCTNPQAKLDLYASSGDHMRFIGRGASDYSDTVFYATDNTTRLGYIDWSNTQSRWNVEANIPLVLYTNASERMRITNAGLISFCCQVGIGAASPIARIHTCTAYNANNLQAVFGNSNGSINCVTYDTVIIQADDVTTLKLVERNTSTVDQVFTMSVGDGSARLSTTCALPIQFFVAGNPSACGYNGLSGNAAMIINSNSKVEIGNTSTSAEVLKVTGCSTLDNYISVYSGTIQVFLDADKTNSAGIVGTQSSHNFKLRSAGINRMNIDTSGNIGAPDSGTNIYNASDLRLKQNINTITNGLDKVLNLNPVKFNWINGFVQSEEGKDMLGFIAQEVSSVVPEAVENFSNNDIVVGENVIKNPLRVNEKFIIPVLVKAIQEQQCQICTQSTIIDQLKICLGLT